MALNGLAPIIIITFFKEIEIPAFLKGFINQTKIPFLPIPIYLDEKITGIIVNDYDRDTTIDVMRDGVSSFERVSADVVNFKFQALKSNIPMTALSAFIDLIIKNNVENKTYSITIFYDNIFIINASLESFTSNLIEGSNKREISIRVSNRPKEKTIADSPLANTAGSALGF
jgi:hypothetical protein